jgi:hypothetical protein
MIFGAKKYLPFFSLFGMPEAIRKCKVLLHLGNQRAFSVDMKSTMTYDFKHSILP